MRRFLLSRLSALGDVVCTLPAAVALKESFPESHVTWAVDPRFAGIVECCTAVDNVVRVKPGFAPSTWPQWDESFDVAIDMQGLLKSALAISRAKAERKLGYHWQREGAWLFSSRVIPDKSSIHIVDQYVDVVRAAGATMERATFGLRPHDDDLITVREKLSASGGPLVIINPGAGWISKRWPPLYFAKVINQLTIDGCTCALIGGKADADHEAAREVLSGCKDQPLNLTGVTTVRELVALLSLASAHLGGDTGSSHLAAALDIPAIGLYSITKPSRSCPYGQIDRCQYHAGGLANIDPSDVYKAVTEALS